MKNNQVASAKLKELVNNLLEAETDPGEVHHCPVCGGQVRVIFSAYTRHGRELLGVQVWCEGCQIALAMDGGGPIPKWVRHLSTD